VASPILKIVGAFLARAREGDPNEKMLSMLRLDNPTLDWVKIAEGQGVPATRATTAEEFHKQFEAAISTKGPRLIEAQIVQNLKPAKSTPSITQGVKRRVELMSITSDVNHLRGRPYSRSTAVSERRFR